MIVICVGTSHTAGIELWEEKNVPNYCTMTEEQAWNNLYYGDVEEERKDLTFTGFLKKMKPDWKVFNFAQPSAAQIQVAMTSINKFNEMKQLYPEEEIIVVSQDPFRHRFTYFNSRTQDYEGVATVKINDYILQQNPDSFEVQEFINKYITDDQIACNYYLSCFGVNDYIESSGGTVIHFNFYNHEAKYKDDTNQYVISLKNKYLNSLQLYPNGVTYRIRELFKITRQEMILPCWHIKQQYHEIIAEDIVRYIESR